MSLIPRDFFSSDDFFPTVFRGYGGSNALTRGMAVDVTESKDAFQVQADVPGVKRDDIHVTVHDDVLRLNVESTEEKEEQAEDKTWHRYERSGTWASRSIRLPRNADLEHIKAKYAEGVLSLDIPKKRVEEGSRRISVA
ncbi:hypothetical protein H632_c205p1 [Helicosporidium sp. ATCC 50920]|nr:hypothetical protein H632_c205p1 [Helicosporidium sp. ATCC 50920]|eukprot:KDD76497.1 hypothetical protein H632_c205p1 [Helicosporidium sp. ATCC 50920]